MSIKILSDDIIKLIRAGEVIERPASIVKELIENSIDANADHIDIKVENGGKSIITVADNGHGISGEDLPMAFHPHATSKLIDINDIGTLGFRGEALASIKHVADVSIVSRVEGDYAWTLDENNEIFPASGSKGTFITVNKLFNEIPARKSFLKSDRLELKHIKTTISEIALSNHNVSFSLFNGNICILPLKKESREERISSIFGNEFIQNSCHVKFQEDEIDVDLYIGIPTWNKHSQIGQHLFINNRPVKNNEFRLMLKGAFQGLSKEQPSCIAWINLPNNHINCNIHPSKKEVQIKNEENIMKVIMIKIRELLAQYGPRSSETLSELAVRLSKPVLYNNDKEENHRLPLGNAIGMFQKNYILSEAVDGLIMIDLHAANERVLLQKLLNEFSQKGLSGREITPTLININHNECQILEEHEDELAKIGFKFNYMDQGISIISIPEMVSDINIQQWVNDVIRMFIDNPYLDPEQEFMENICSLIACHNAFRRQELTVDEMNIFLREIENIPFTAQCNHGRPTSILFTIDDMEKMFKR